MSNVIFINCILKDMNLINFKSFIWLTSLLYINIIRIIFIYIKNKFRIYLLYVKIKLTIEFPFK